MVSGLDFPSASRIVSRVCLPTIFPCGWGREALPTYFTYWCPCWNVKSSQRPGGSDALEPRSRQIRRLPIGTKILR